VCSYRRRGACAQGEGFIRISSFGHREDVLEAVARLVKVLKK
jgi:hypothetical protein